MKKIPKIVAVTGTNGKSSVVEFIRQIYLSQGLKACTYGTLGFVDHLGNRTHIPIGTGVQNDVLIALQQKISEADYAVIACEAYSKSLAGGFWSAVKPDVAAFTSFAWEHMSFHHTMEAYWEAKCRLFKDVISPDAGVVVNLDKEYEQKLNFILEGRGIVPLCIRSSDELRFTVDEETIHYTRGTLAMFGERYQVTLPFFGDIMIENLLVALGVLHKLQFKMKNPAETLSKLSLPKGRLEVVGNVNDAAIIIDYAHTQDALTAVLTNLKRVTKGKVHLVFGCGGETDEVKRREMALAAESLAHNVYLTDDNPRFENAGSIRSFLKKFCPHGIEVPERSEAIRTAINNLAAGDVLIITGKGHEVGQEINGNIFPFSDHDVVVEMINDLKTKAILETSTSHN